MKGLVAFFKKKTIQKQIQFTVIFVSVFSMLTLGGGSFLVFRRAIEKNYKEDFSYNLEITNSIMNIQLKDIVKLSRDLLTNKDVTGTLQAAEKMDKKSFDYMQTKVLEKNFNTLVYQNEFIAEIAIIDSKGRSYYFHKNLGVTSYYGDDDILQEEWIKKTCAAQGKEVFFAGNVLDEEKSESIFSMVKQLRDIDDNNEIGYVVINIRKKVFDTSFVKLNSEYTSNSFFIADKNNEIAYYTGESEDQENILEEYKNKNDQNNYICTESYNELLGWNITSVVNKNELFGDSTIIGAQIFIMILVIIVGGTILSRVIATWIYRPLYQLSEMISQVGRGKRQLEGEIDEGEVGKIGRQFKEMVHDNLELHENLLIAKVKEREAELMLLQAQINPHFLYNTLDSIYCMAVIEEQNKIAGMVEHLSKMFRLSLNQGSKYVCVKEEVAHLTHYMEIQNYRFHDRFKLVLDIPAEVEELYMLKFILQPFVENAVYHGLEPKIDGGTIKVIAKVEEQHLFFSIKDNGVGMENIEKAYAGYGIKNVIERIGLFYGRECGVKLISQEGKGTMVTIKLLKTLKGGVLYGL